MPRAYRQLRRADQQAQTRQRIVGATVELHGTIGPAETTISAIADLADVQRVTVYKHFPDERALFAACTAHWQSINPPPDMEFIASTTDPRLRLKLTLEGLYDWFAANERMIALGLRDLPQKPALAESMAPLIESLLDIRTLLAAGWDEDEAHPVRVAAIGHAIEFTTWSSLVRNQSLTQDEAVVLMLNMIESVSDDKPSD